MSQPSEEAELRLVPVASDAPIEVAAAPDSQALDQPAVSLAAAMVLGSVAFLAMNVDPILLAALAEKSKITNQDLGRIATVELLALAVGSCLGPGLLRRGGLRRKVMAAIALLIGLNLASYVGDHGAALYGLRAACGLCEGIMLAATSVVLTYTRHPERLNGYFLGLSAVPQVCVTYLLPTVVMPRLGDEAGFGLMAAFDLVALVAAFGVSDRNVPPTPAAQTSTRRPIAPLAWFALLVLGVQNVAVGAAFNYLVQVGNQAAIPEQAIGVALAGLQLAATLSALLVGWQGWRLSHLWVLVVGSLSQAAIAVGLAAFHASVAYLALCCLFGLVWNGLLPFGLKLLIEADPSRRVALLNSPTSMLGLGVGPLVASMVVKAGDVRPALSPSAGIFTVTGGLYLLTGLWSRRRRAQPAPG